MVQGANEDSCSHVLSNFQAAIKPVIVSVRLILPKVRVDEFTGLQQEINIGYEFGLKLILKGLG